VVTALHACDTATDDAIAFGLQKKARCMVLVPCCQAELARLLNQHKALNLQRTPLAELWRHPLHTREMGSQLTNVLRCLYLESQGYKVTVTELVGWEHSMKNELILAEYTGQHKPSAGLRLRALLEQFGLEALQTLRYPLLRNGYGALSVQATHYRLPRFIVQRHKVALQCGLAHALQGVGMGSTVPAKQACIWALASSKVGKFSISRSPNSASMLFHIHPDKPCLWHFFGQSVEQRLVFAAGAAPLRTQAKHP
jgi:hypothetical protein